jgi:hypothetical protein
MTEAERARRLLIALATPGLLICALVPLVRALLFALPPQGTWGHIIRAVAFLPWFVLTIVGVVTPFAWPFVVAMSIYRVATGQFRGRRLAIPALCLIGSTLGIYVWFGMVGESLHGHAIPMFPWDPPGLSAR